MSFIEVQNVSFRYADLNGTETENIPLALNHISLQVEKSTFLAIVGHNGSGKSTLSKMLNGIYLPTEGKVIVDGMDTADNEHLFDIRRNVGLVQQNPDNQIVAGIVEEDVAFGCENLGMSPKEIRSRVDMALKAVDMYDYRLYSPEKLSGGQKQRVAIAGILAMQPQCIVLDEPTAMLDPKGRTEVMETIHELNRKQGITIILITHYMEEAVEADRVVVVDGGKILLSGKPIEVFSQVDLLKAHRLDVPQATELVYRLQKSGFDIPCVLNEEICVEQIARLFGKTVLLKGGV